jgi:hypothetical protein
MTMGCTSSKSQGVNTRTSKDSDDEDQDNYQYGVAEKAKDEAFTAANPGRLRRPKSRLSLSEKARKAIRSSILFLTATKYEEDEVELEDWDILNAPNNDKCRELTNSILKNPFFKTEMELRAITNEDIETLVGCMRLVEYAPGCSLFHTGTVNGRTLT